MHDGIYLCRNVSLGSFGQRKSLLIIYAKLFLNTIINDKSQTLLSDFFEDWGGCTQAKRLLKSNPFPALSVSRNATNHKILDKNNGECVSTLNGALINKH